MREKEGKVTTNHHRMSQGTCIRWSRNKNHCELNYVLCWKYSCSYWCIIRFGRKRNKLAAGNHECKKTDLKKVSSFVDNPVHEKKMNHQASLIIP